MKIAVIADDLTGANATGVQLRKSNLKCYTLTDIINFNKVNDTGVDCVIANTNSRSLSRERAYSVVYGTAISLKHPSVQHYSKRIDSTLRGNVGAEIDALLDALDDDHVALVVPSFPDAGRIVVGGHLLVNGIPLHLTEAAQDPKAPIFTPIVDEVVAQQTKYTIGHLHIKELAKGTAHISKEILRIKSSGTRIIIFDGTTNEDLALIAQAAIASGVKFISADPGAFTNAVAKELIQPTSQNHKKVLVVVGSINAVAIGQVNKFLTFQKCHNVLVDVNRIISDEASRTLEINRVVTEILEQAPNFEVLSVVGSGLFPENRINFEKYSQPVEEVSSVINTALAQIGTKILDTNSDFDSIYTCGGDISLAICDGLGAHGIELFSEVVPLASYGKLVGGSKPGLKIITKGGMVGDEDALIVCVNFLKERT